MGDSDMSPKAKVSYDQNKFEVEFNVADYLPEVSGSGRGSWLGGLQGGICIVHQKHNNINRGQHFQSTKE